MSTGGQALGGVVGAIGGFFLAGPKGALYGAQIGIAIGGYLDPPKGPNTEGPRLSDLHYQTSLYGAPIPRVYGTVAITGNVFWLENNQIRESSHTESQGGGKGGGGSKTKNTTYSYSATFAVGLCEGPITGVRRIWVGPNLIYDSGSSDPTAVMASNQAATGFTVHTGSDTQLPDARMQATLGAANTPAYRGLAYIVFNDFALAPYGNSLAGAQVKAEVVKAGGSVFGYLRGIEAPSMVPVDANTYYAACSYFGDGEFLVFVPQFKYGGPIYPISFKGYRVLSDASQQYLGIFSTGWMTGTANPCFGKLDIQGFVVVAETGARIIVMTLNGDRATFLNDQGWFGAARIAKSGDDFFAESPDSGYRIARWSYAQGLGGAATFLAKSSVTSALNCDQLAVFGDVLYRIGPTYLTKFDKASLIFLSQIALPTGTYWSLDVHADNDIYVHEGAGGRVYRWDGASWTNTGMLTPSWGTANKTFRFNDGVLTVSIDNWVFFYGTTTSIQTVTLASIVQAECLASKLLTLGDINTTELTQVVRGYRVSAVSALRSAIEPLQGAWPFDVVQHGYTIQFKVRGSASVATIAASELDARGVGDAPGVSITNSREMDLILPAKMLINYLDADREYDNGTQPAERLSTAATNIQSIEMAIVLTSAEAAAIVERLLYLYWMERYDISFSLPPTRQALEPGDVIDVQATEANYNLRLTEITYEQDGRLSCKAKYNSSAVYVPAALGVAGVPSSGNLALSGDPNTLFLDIPCLLSVSDQPGFPVAMSGYTAGWNGGTLYKSTDGEQTWFDVQGFAAPGAVAGVVSNATTILTTALIDKSSILVCAFPNSAPYSATELAVLNGANLFAYGRAGRWELMGAQNVDLQGDGTYFLSGLHRGRFGTEQYANTHEAGDSIILLDANTIPFVLSDLNAIGVAGAYRSVTLGKTIDAASTQTFTYSAVNLKPLSPVYLNGNRHPTTNDWALTWIRRTRIGGEWRDAVDASLGEASELYDVEIYSSSAYTTLKRTFASLASATTPYTSAQQVTDFGSNQATLYVKVYQLSADVGRGYPLTTSITR